MTDFPTLVFVPGAWHRPSCYGKVVKLLQEQYQLRCSLVTLPSTSGDPEATFKDDLDAARTAIANETDHGRNVVVIAHSYGGLVGNSAIKGFARPRPDVASNSPATSSSPEAAGEVQSSVSGYVVGLVLIASGFTFTGLSFMDPFLGIPPPAWKINKDTGFADFVVPPGEFFYHDLPAEEREYWVSQLAPQSLKSLFEGGEYTYSGWKDVPAWYIGTVEDQGLPVVVQRMNVGMAREMGATVEHRELQTSHSPFLSQPDEVAEILVEAVEDFSGKPVERIKAERQGNKVVSPAARLWQPLTWLKFGLPLFFGHIIGRGIVAFSWCRRLWSVGLR
ncbi:hypothetical protein TWF225_006764 [Orbilia oligospora]|nr:hypothetical protein TWF225_006764 [Orbilia oligospora]KAF3233778.1 hypothetical protein TWF128_002887 [Orbilia oligospora]KAF3233779.1 hypothetical protein TWF128_002887 [Orbilia oligospora]KAF3237484.1 hypothetical protein TWF217_002106 [Orbilia oligospora]